MMQPPAAPIAARELRPRRRWYLVGLGVFLLCLVAGGVVAAALVAAGARQGGDLHRLADGNQVTLAAGNQKYLYSSTEPDDPFQPPACTASGPGTVSFRGMRSSQTMTRNSVTWVAVARLSVSASGRYTITCPAGAEYAVGYGAFGVLGRVFGGIGAFFGLALLGFLAGGTIALVTLVRRSSDRRRRQLTAGYAPPPPPTVR